MVTRAAFGARVADRALLFDGATGTVLQHRWSGTGHGFEGLNLTAPEIVAGAHDAYVRAGADVIETNTFGANRFRLDEHGLGERVAEVNAAAAAIAREAVAGTDVWVAGSVGPLGVVLAPIGRVVEAEARTAFSEQIEALVGSGVDLLVIETMPSISEVQIAASAARELAPDLPIIAMMTFADDDRTMLGLGAAEVGRELAGLDVDAVGVNCSSGPNQVLRLTERDARSRPRARDRSDAERRVSRAGRIRAGRLSGDAGVLRRLCERVRRRGGQDHRGVLRHLRRAHRSDARGDRRGASDHDRPVAVGHRVERSRRPGLGRPAHRTEAGARVGAVRHHGRDAAAEGHRHAEDGGQRSDVA